jgi:hypothetical protein
MADHIPIVTGNEIGNLIKNIYGDSAVVRIPLDRGIRFKAIVPHISKLWVDPGFDGCDDIEARRSKPHDRNEWFEFMNALPHFEKLAQSVFLAKPAQPEANAIVKELLNQCAAFKPQG